MPQGMDEAEVRRWIRSTRDGLAVGGEYFVVKVVGEGVQVLMGAVEGTRGCCNPEMRLKSWYYDMFAPSRLWQSRFKCSAIV